MFETRMTTANVFLPFMIPSPPIWTAWTSWRSRSRDRIQRYVRGRVTQRPRRRPSVPCGYLSSPFKLNSPRDQGVVCYAEPCARHLASETASAFVLLTTLGTTQAQSEQNRVDGWNAALPGATPLPAAVEIEPGDARDEEEYTCFGIRSHSPALIPTLLSTLHSGSCPVAGRKLHSQPICGVCKDPIS